MASTLSVALLRLLIVLSIYSEASNRKELRDNDKLIQLGHPVQSQGIDPSKVIQLSWRPRIFLYKGFLSEKDCDHLISLAQGRKSKTASNRLLLSIDTSLDMEDATIAKIQEKISAWIFLPEENSLPIQVMQFESEDPKVQYDYHRESEGLMATVVMYLSNVTSGGELIFPESEELTRWSDCGIKENILRPIKGNAILFFSRHLNAALDNKSSHSRCPVREGEMWSAMKSYYITPVDRRKPEPENEESGCTDEDENCPQWAKMGECQRNPVFMVGSPDYYGTCRKSCDAC